MQQTACVFMWMFACMCVFSGYRALIRDILSDVFSQSVMASHGLVVQLLSRVQLFAPPWSAGDSWHLDTQCELLAHVLMSPFVVLSGVWSFECACPIACQKHALVLIFLMLLQMLYISIFDCSFFVYGNWIDFCTLIFYCVTLPYNY